MYKKRDGTSGILGQLYETKLLSLIYFRAKHKDIIDKFHLAANVDGIGAFDDICFRANIKEFNRPLTVFIQAKHRENNSVVILHKKAELIKYFDSYLRIRRNFSPYNQDVLFNGEFDKTECLFVVYTTARDNFKCKSVHSKSADILNDLLNTGGTVKQPLYENQDVNILYEVALKEQISSLANQFTKYLFHEADFQMMLADELILRYHVVIAERMMSVSDIKPEGHRIAYFSDDFFDTNEEYVMLFKQRFFTEILKKRKVDNQVANKYLTLLFKEPSVITLSELIGTVITYNKHGNLEFTDKKTPEELKLKLKKVYLSQSTADTVVAIAAKNMLQKQMFKVPAAFGNKDLTIRGNDRKIEKRLEYLTQTIIDLLEKSKANNMLVTIDESFEKGFLKLNGGIAGAVGNILVLDKNTQHMKFIDNSEFLEQLAKRLFEKIKVKIDNLHEYRFEAKVTTFPKLSFDCTDEDVVLLKDFLDKLILYSDQAHEDDVENILKDEIQEYQCNNVEQFLVRSDAVFLKYHDMIQKWWKLPKQGPYLTKDIEHFDDLIRNIVEDPLSSVLNVIYGLKINNVVDYTFEENTMFALNLNHLDSSIIITQSTALTVAKVTQYLKNKDYIILDLEYLLNLSINYCNALCNELKNVNKNKKLIIVCSNVLNSRNRTKTMENIVKAVDDRIKIVITNENSIEDIKKYFPEAINIVNDKRNNLIDLNEDTRQTILNNTRITFQGVDVGLNLVVNENAITLIEAHVLNKITNNEKIVVGKSLTSHNYEEIKHLYVPRRVDRGNLKKSIAMDSLNDIADDVVLITAKPGMGKSTLLTHLSLKTQELDSKVWIVRINLLDHATEYSKWQDSKTVIDYLETLNFMCRIALNDKHDEVNTIALEEVNGVVTLKRCNGDESVVFEIKMFLHFFNNGRIIFIFDGFDEICPHYANEVTQLLKNVKNYPKHQLWIASRSYNKIKSILQREFGTSYEMQHLSSDNKVQYLEKFWKSNLFLKELDNVQLDNVFEFLEFMFENNKMDCRTEFTTLKKLQHLPLQYVYRHAYKYLKNEFNNAIPKWSYYKTKFYETDVVQFISGSPLIEYNGEIPEMIDMYKFLGTPLHLFLLAEYFINEIKDINRKTNKWNLDINTYTIYKRFLETKLKRIRFQEKNKMEISNPDIRITYEKECFDFINKHKKLAAYAIFNQDIRQIISKKDLQDIKNMIKFIKLGGEKTGVVYRVASKDIPIFVHTTFAEYFAVEYFCDLLKNEKCCKVQKSMMYFLFNIMIIESSANVHNIMDSKLKIDNALMKIIEKNENVIFDLLMEQAKSVGETWREKHICDGFYDDEDLNYETEIESSLYRAVYENLANFVVLFISIFNKYLNKDNLDDFIDLIDITEMIRAAVTANCEEFLLFAIDIVKKIDISKLRLLFLHVRHFPFINYDEYSNEDILEILRICEARQANIDNNRLRLKLTCLH